MMWPLYSPRLITHLSSIIEHVPVRAWNILVFFVLFMTVGQCIDTATFGETKLYSMSRTICNGVYRNVPAALLEGVGSPKKKVPTLCDVTLTTPGEEYVWMLRFEKAVINDCTVYVSVFNSTTSQAERVPEVDLGCVDKDPGIMIINSNTINIRLRHKNATDFTFRIALTAILSNIPEESDCSGFTCANGPCVALSLICDDVDNCFDGSDELHNGTSQCYDSIWPLEGENWGVLASVLGVALVVGGMTACCRHIKSKRQSTVDDLYDLNEGPYVHKYAYRYAIIRPPKKPNKTKAILGRDGHMHYTSTTV